VDIRSLGYRTDLMVRHLAGASVSDRGRYIVVRTPDNPWFHWGNFLLWADPPDQTSIGAWISAFGEEFPDATHVTFGIDGTEPPEGHDRSFPLALETELSVVMTSERPPDDRPVAGGVAVRPLRSADDWRQYLLLRREEEGRDRPVPPGHAQFLQRSTEEARRLVETGRAGYLGAFVDHRLRSAAGIVSDGAGVARFQNVGTHPAHRRRGLASALLARAGAFGFSDLGADRLVIVADQDGPAVGLYRSLGFVPVEVQWGLSAPTGPGSARSHPDMRSRTTSGLRKTEPLGPWTTGS
jgi:ribosomal protein S18 acetylase RimI-like enzyme